MPPETKFDKGKKFMITTISVEPKHSRPTFTKNNCTHYNYIVKAIVKGNTEPTTFEYASPTQDALDVFVANVPQWVICMQPSDIACNIQPCEPPGEEKSAQQMARELVEPKPTPGGMNPIRSFLPDNTSSKEWGFVFAWAKDLVVAEMNNGGRIADLNAPGYPIERISYYAGRIYKDMMQKIQEG